MHYSIIKISGAEQKCRKFRWKLQISSFCNSEIIFKLDTSYCRNFRLKVGDFPGNFNLFRPVNVCFIQVSFLRNFGCRVSVFLSIGCFPSPRIKTVLISFEHLVCSCLIRTKLIVLFAYCYIVFVKEAFPVFQMHSIVLIPILMQSYFLCCEFLWSLAIDEIQSVIPN